MQGSKPIEKLSLNPRQIRIRARRTEGRTNRDAELYVEHVYKKPLEDWDLEELARGRPRNKDGKFTGAPPSWITPLVMREAKRRLLDETFGALAGHAHLAVRTIVKLMQDKSVDDHGRPIVDARTKLAAAQFVIEHIIGKPKALLEVGTSDDVKAFLASALIMSKENPIPAHPVIDGQYSEEEETEDDDTADA